MTYTGLCIGGPLDRQPHTHTYYYYRVVASDEVFSYRFLSFTDLVHEGQMEGFWIPEEWSTLTLIRTLAAHYQDTPQHG